MTTIADIRARVRKDLHDEDALNYRWTDGELDRHIQHTVREFSLAVPLEAKTTLATTAGSRDLSITGLTDLVAIEAVEYPVGAVPAGVRALLRLALDPLAAHRQDPRRGRERAHLLDEAAHDRRHLIDVGRRASRTSIASGAAGYAALEWASFSTNRVNVGGRDVWREYLIWGQERLAEFQRALARYGRRNAVRARRLYAPARRRVDQATVVGP